MNYMVGGLTGLVVAFLIGASFPGMIGFALFGALAGILGAMEVGAVETFYWIMLLILVVLLAAAFFGIGVSSFLIMLPVVMMVSRLIAMWTSGLVTRYQS